MPESLISASKSVAGKLGGEALIRKYGRVPVDESYRKKRWREWWNKTGQFRSQSILTPKSVLLPKKNAILAEFIGIAMGDGGISKNQVVISLNSEDDAEYALFVSKLMHKMFRIRPSIYPSKQQKVTDIVISRVRLVQYLHKLGLPVGNKIKQGLDMPTWVKRRRSYAIACVRGLVDTDGCIFTHRYLVKGKRYSYKKLSFTSASPQLLNTVYELFTAWGLHPRLGGSKDVRIDRIADIKKYLKLIGTHNPKH